MSNRRLVFAGRFSSGPLCLAPAKEHPSGQLIVFVRYLSLAA